MIMRREEEMEKQCVWIRCYRLEYRIRNMEGKRKREEGREVEIVSSSSSSRRDKTSLFGLNSLQWFLSFCLFLLVM